MALRRPRFKPTANLKPRRAPSAVGDSLLSQPSATIKEEENTDKPVKKEVICPNTSSEQNIEIRKEDIHEKIEQNVHTTIEPNEIPFKEEQPKSAPAQTKTNSVRRIIKPAVCLPTERSKKPNASVKVTDEQSENSENIKKVSIPNESNEQKYTSSDNNQEISETKTELVAIKIKNLPEISTIQKAEKTVTNADNISTDNDTVTQQIDNDSLSSAKVAESKESPDYFKSPFMSPSMQNSHQKYWSHPSPGIDDLMPLSPARVRQRIRPTPCFGNRRNSIQVG